MFTKPVLSQKSTNGLLMDAKYVQPQECPMTSRVSSSIIVTTARMGGEERRIQGFGGET